jgi:hypothetical protein
VPSEPLVRDQQKSTVRIVLNDISERKKMEAKAAITFAQLDAANVQLTPGALRRVKVRRSLLSKAKN